MSQRARLASGVALLALLPLSSTQAQDDMLTDYVGNKNVASYALSVTTVTPSDRVLEHTPVTVTFTLTSTAALGNPAAEHIRICPERYVGAGDSCAEVLAARAGNSYTRTLNTFAPRAGATPGSINLAAYVIPKARGLGGRKKGRRVAEVSHAMATAAEYRVALVGFAPLRTRAVQADTIKISLEARVEGQRSAADDACTLIEPLGPGSAYCVKLINNGDTGGPRGRRVTNVEVGPYRLVPGVDPDLVFSFQVLNMGESYSQEVFLEVMNGISGAALGAMSASGIGGDWEKAHDLTNKINGLMWAGCDGPVAVDVRTGLNKPVEGHWESTLVSRTDDTGFWEQKEPSVGDFADRGYYEYESQDGCGRSSQYQAVWRITRASWQPKE